MELQFMRKFAKFRFLCKSIVNWRRSGAALLLVPIFVFPLYFAHVLGANVKEVRVGKQFLPMSLRNVVNQSVVTPPTAHQAYFFFTTTCPHCQRQLALLEELNPTLLKQKVIPVSLSSLQNTAIYANDTGFKDLYVVDKPSLDTLHIKRVPVLVLTDDGSRIELFDEGERSVSYETLVFQRFHQGLPLDNLHLIQESKSTDAH